MTSTPRTRIAAATAASAAVLTLGAATASALDNGDEHPEAGPLAITSATVALAAGAGGLILMRRAAKPTRKPAPQGYAARSRSCAPDRSVESGPESAPPSAS